MSSFCTDDYIPSAVILCTHFTHTLNTKFLLRVPVSRGREDITPPQRGSDSPTFQWWEVLLPSHWNLNQCPYVVLCHPSIRCCDPHFRLSGDNPPPNTATMVDWVVLFMGNVLYRLRVCDSSGDFPASSNCRGGTVSPQVHVMSGGTTWSAQPHSDSVIVDTSVRSQGYPLQTHPTCQQTADTRVEQDFIRLLRKKKVYFPKCSWVIVIVRAPCIRSNQMQSILTRRHSAEHGSFWGQSGRVCLCQMVYKAQGTQPVHYTAGTMIGLQYPWMCSNQQKDREEHGRGQLYVYFKHTGWVVGFLTGSGFLDTLETVLNCASY